MPAKKKRSGAFAAVNQSKIFLARADSCEARFTGIWQPRLNRANPSRPIGSSWLRKGRKSDRHFDKSAMENLSMSARSLATDTILGCSGSFAHLRRATL